MATPRGTTTLNPLLAAMAGVVVGVLMTAGWWLLYNVDLLTFPPYDLGDVFIRESPGRFATWAIETLGSRAQSLALLGGVVVWHALWGVVGLVASRLPSRWQRQLAPLPLGAIGLLIADLAGSDGLESRLLWNLLAIGSTLLAGGFLLAYWLERLEEAQREADSPADDWLAHPGDYQRRQLIRQLALIAVGAGSAGWLAGRLLRGTGAFEETTAQRLPLPSARAELGSPVALPTAEPAGPFVDEFDAPRGVRPRLTSNDEFYVVDISTRDPVIEETSWTLRVSGLVERELLLTWADLLAMPAIELDGTLMCISYEHDNGLISTTRWTGVRLRDVLERAGVREGVVDLACRGANHYSDSIPLAKALEPTTLLAYGMNGETLPRAHGFPCRLYVPGLYGEKNVKWLEEIELVEYDYRGYWQERGWTDIATIQTVSIIDTPRGTVPRESNVVPIAGIAFAGDRGISAVQVRIDDGPWLDAELEANEPPLIWQRWRYDWQPALGGYEITVRAVDSKGAVQDETVRPPHPDGMTGLHSVRVDVV